MGEHEEREELAISGAEVFLTIFGALFVCLWLHITLALNRMVNEEAHGASE